MQRKMIAVFGVSNPKDDQKYLARELGKRIAEEGWILVNGGLGGVMEESARGASVEGGEVLGILPGSKKRHANQYVTLPVVTNMGHARNVIIAQSADACIAIGQGYGTLSEIAIALKESKLVISLKSWNIPGVKFTEDIGRAIEMIKEEIG